MSPMALTSIRPRRLLIFIFTLFTLVCIFGVPWELPQSLKDTGLSSLSPANIAQLARFRGSSAKKVDEIYGLLHLVTREDEPTLSLDSDPSKPIPLDTYANGERSVHWRKNVQRINHKYPVVVFSKSYCGYSQRAKNLLEHYNIEPSPKVIEVDLRKDSNVIKGILARLTNRSTFPNIIVHGQSLGGSDDLQALHEQDKLKALLQKAGVAVRPES